MRGLDWIGSDQRKQIVLELDDQTKQIREDKSKKRGVENLSFLKCPEGRQDTSRIREAIS